MQEVIFDPPIDAIMVLLDVDYYIDMPTLLLGEFRPYLIYTFVPTSAACDRGNYSYTFLADGSIMYKLSTGKTYNHQLWDYSYDSLLIKSTTSKDAVSYSVKWRRVGRDPPIILLLPVCNWSMYSVVQSDLTGKPLVRFNPVVDGFVRFYVQTEYGLYICTVRVGMYNGARVKMSYDDAIRTLQLVSKQGVIVQSCINFVEHKEYIEQKVASTTLVDYHKSVFSEHYRPIVFTPDYKSYVRGYEFGVETFDNDDVPTMVSYMKPFINQGLAPLKTKTNEQKGIDERILKIASKPENFNYNFTLKKAMDEFLELLIPVPHLLVPKCLDCVYEKQKRHSQQAILHRAEVVDGKDTLESFMKKEAYGKCSHPRMIHTFDGPLKRDFAQYIYAFSELIVLHGWYAFGVTPLVLSERIAAYLQYCDNVTLSDAVRLDGTVSIIMRLLEKRALLRAFARTLAGDIVSLHGRQCNTTVYSAFGIKYKLGTQRASGAQGTSVFTTIAICFIAFFTYRTCPKPLSVKHAWNKLGMFGGDDGLTGDIDLKHYIKCGKLVGVTLKCTQIKRGEIGVNFLSRMYGPFVWFGDNNSCCDLARQIIKFHLTVCLPGNVTGWEKFLEKIRAFYYSDSNTPVLGELATKVVSIYGLTERRDVLLPMMSWIGRYDQDVQYPNELADWMIAYSQFSLKKYCFNYDVFKNWLQAAVLPAQFMNPRECFIPIPVETTDIVVVDGEKVFPVLAQRVSKRTLAWRKKKTDKK
jgi:hypothetical protein